jgi:DNA-binding CsgD family transcriptional regulator
MNNHAFIDLAGRVESATKELRSARGAVAVEQTATNFIKEERIHARKLKVAPKTWEPAVERKAFEVGELRRKAIDRTADAGKLFESLFDEFSDETINRWPEERAVLDAIRANLNTKIWTDEGLEAVIDWTRRMAKRAAAEIESKPQEQRQGRRKRRAMSPRPLTVAQTKTMKTWSVNGGDVGATAIMLKCTRQTVSQHLKAVERKLGKKLLAPPAKREKMPVDQRGQINIPRRK